MLRAARQVKATLIFDTFVPFPPLTSLILTRHLNKEVRAMIKSLHSVDCVARQTLDPSHPCVNPTPLFVTSSLQLLVGVACQWWS